MIGFTVDELIRLYDGKVITKDEVRSNLLEHGIILVDNHSTDSNQWRTRTLPDPSNVDSEGGN